jgi:DNA-binding MarR family transcriptional regulator
MIELSRSSGERKALHAELVTLIMRWQDATQAFDEAVGERLDLGMAERHCLSLLHGAPRPAGEIAAEIGLTPAAVTSLVDRLEARGFVERQRSETDRRQVLVAMTDAAAKATQRYYGPIAREGQAVQEKFSTPELAVVVKFMKAALELQQRHIERIRADKTKPPTGLKGRLRS